MGIAPTGAIFRGLTFDGENSKDYGIYITGTGVYNAPERDVEMIAIPGRNGNFAHDNGRFANVEVTYHCGLFGPSQEDFAEAISDFRNMLLSRRGYVRLTDDYNADEYRMAIYKAGLEVTADAVRAGEFDLVFDCKPQRFLTSGETAVSVASGDTLTNPTLFDAHPLLSFEGLGDINIGDNSITVNDVPLGWIDIAPPNTIEGGRTIECRRFLDTSNIVTGDTINVGDTRGWLSNTNFFEYLYPDLPFDDATITYGDRDFNFGVTLSRRGTSAEIGGGFWGSLTYGTRSSHHGEATIVFKKYESGSMRTLATINIEVIVDYRDDNLLLVVQADTTPTRAVLVASNVIADSTKSTLSGVTYVDLDIAEAYVLTGGEMVSANGHVSIGAVVPSLPPGDTEITYDDTITNVTITPRWWKV